MANAKIKVIIDIDVYFPDLPEALILKVLNKIIPNYGKDCAAFYVDYKIGEENKSDSVHIIRKRFQRNDKNKIVSLSIELYNFLSTYEYLYAVQNKFESMLRQAESDLFALNDQRNNIKLMFPEIDFKKFGLEVVQ